MKNWMNKRVAQCAVTLICCALAAPVLAQQGNIRRITFYKVKPDRVGEFQDATKQLMEAIKKAGSPRGIAMWQSASGPTEYVSVVFYEKWAELDLAPGSDPRFAPVAGQIQTAIARRNDTLASPATVVVDELLPDLSIINRTLTPDQLPKVVRVLKTSVRTDKINEYMDLVKKEVLPVYKKAGKKLYAVSRTRYGAPTREFRSVTDIQGWADFDKPAPLVTAMGQAGYDAFLVKIGALTTSSEVNVYRLQMDISYFPAAK